MTKLEHLIELADAFSKTNIHTTTMDGEEVWFDELLGWAAKEISRLETQLKEHVRALDSTMALNSKLRNQA